MFFDDQTGNVTAISHTWIDVLLPPGVGQHKVYVIINGQESETFPASYDRKKELSISMLTPSSSPN